MRCYERGCFKRLLKESAVLLEGAVYIAAQREYLEPTTVDFRFSTPSTRTLSTEFPLSARDIFWELGFHHLS